MENSIQGLVQYYQDVNLVLEHYGYDQDTFQTLQGLGLYPSTAAMVGYCHRVEAADLIPHLNHLHDEYELSPDEVHEEIYSYYSGLGTIRSKEDISLMKSHLMISRKATNHHIESSLSTYLNKNVNNFDQEVFNFLVGGGDLKFIGGEIDGMLTIYNYYQNEIEPIFQAVGKDKIVSEIQKVAYWETYWDMSKNDKIDKVRLFFKIKTWEVSQGVERAITQSRLLETIENKYMPKTQLKGKDKGSEIELGM